jgi:hypothetical protein
MKEKHIQSYISGMGAAALRWILPQLHSKTVLAHIGAFPYKCTIKHPFHTTAKWKALNFMKTISLLSVLKKQTF